jgi:hypothetical protein
MWPNARQSAPKRAIAERATAERATTNALQRLSLRLKSCYSLKLPKNKRFSPEETDRWQSDEASVEGHDGKYGSDLPFGVRDVRSHQSRKSV